MKKGFTIVELLMVIGIIAILMGIITTAASSSVKMGRRQKATALCTLVQTGLATYYAQEGRWPTSICNNPKERTNKEGPRNGSDWTTDPDKIVLKASEVRECVLALVKKAKDNRPMMDISGLFVSRFEGKYGQKCSGLDFMQAIRGTKQSPKKMSSNEMYFGYPDESTGHFRHFKMVYSIPGDSLSVMKMDSEKQKADFYE